MTVTLLLRKIIHPQWDEGAACFTSLIESAMTYGRAAAFAFGLRDLEARAELRSPEES